MRFVLFLVAAAPIFATPVAAKTVAILQGLDKITARISRIEAPVDSPVRFGTLTILVR
ncbi:MAG: DUF2155 domain-containing protein, partial [Rhodospirillales bacterium]|nr:DUF2155 domain-containing protein [Rhodospirillales bacterium]